MRTVLVLLTLVIATPLIGMSVIVAAMLGVRDRPGGIFDLAPRAWGWLLCRAAGVRVHLHGAERIAQAGPAVYVSNHVSWFDVFAIASVLPHNKFVAKVELERIPLFGRAMRAAGFIFIDRNNRKAAFAGYEVAAQRIRDGVSVVVFPEGTRGDEYALRPFKKGPFVLAIAAGVPVIPTLVHGTREVQRRGSMRVRAGDVHLHFLEPVATHGVSYAERDRISTAIWERMALAQEANYGVPSGAPSTIAPDPEGVETSTTAATQLTTH